jgi:hypothetical protein
LRPRTAHHLHYVLLHSFATRCHCVPRLLGVQRPQWGGSSSSLCSGGGGFRVGVGTKDLPICIALSSHCHRNRKKANAPVILADIIYIDVHRLGVTSTNPLSSGSVHIYAPPPSPPPTCTPPAAPCSIFTAASAWHGTAGAARASDLLLKGRGTRVSHRANVGGCAAMTMLSDSNLKCHIRVFP